MRRIAAPIVFAALVIATVAAFFVTTRLKRSPPVISQLTFTRHFSPNGDGRRDVALLGFRLRRSDDVTVSIVTRDGGQVRVLAADRALVKGRRYRFSWDGRTQAGGVAPNGEYHVRVGLRRQGRTVTSGCKLFLDTRSPRVVVRYVKPDTISPDGAGGRNRATLRFSGPRRRPELLVYRTDRGKPVLVARRKGRSGNPQMEWDGRVDRAGAPAPPGDYLLVVAAFDAAGNRGPRPLPPKRGQLAGHPGVTVRYLAALAPRRAVMAGGLARFRVFADGRRYRWRLRRLGSRRILHRGTSSRKSLTVRAPRGRSGVALLELRVGARAYATPLAVRSPQRRRVLVVLPAATWYARNPVDSSGDGFPDVLPANGSVSVAEPLAGRGMPRGFASHEAPLLRHLDREHLRYDLATDLELAQGQGPPLDRYRGVLFASSPVFVPRAAMNLIRAYLRVGGRVSWIGMAGFTSPVDYSRDLLFARGRLRQRNLFGEPLAGDPRGGPVTVLADRIGFFAGVTGAFGPFPALEEATGVPPRARLLAAAGRESDRSALAVYRVPRGVIARVGIEGFALALGASPDAERIMARLWTLLSR